jgi:hypothetical protein
MVFEIFSSSSNFILTFYHFNAVNAKSTPINIVNWVFIEKCSNASSSVYEKCEIPIGVLVVSC